MDWKHAGRPSKNKKAKDKPAWLEQEWTKEELSVISATDAVPIVLIAIAVVKQWIRDGKPMQDIESIKHWLGIIKYSLECKNNSSKSNLKNILDEV